MSNNLDLVQRINWEKIKPLERCAGGHDEQMKLLLENSTVLAHYNEGDYQGQVATCVRLNDTAEIVCYSDWYGSCAGCDAWEDATDEDVLNMCKQLASKAKIFSNVEECEIFLALEKYEPVDYEWNDISKKLLEELKGVVKP